MAPEEKLTAVSQQIKMLDQERDRLIAERDRLVMELYPYKQWTLSRLGEAAGMSAQGVQRIVRKNKM